MNKDKFSFDFRKYFKNNYAENLNYFLKNRKDISNFIFEFVNNKNYLDTYNSVKNDKNNIFFIPSYEYDVYNLEDFENFYNEKKKKFSNSNVNKLVYFFIENEDYIIATNNYYPVKKYLEKNRKINLYDNKENLIKHSKFFVSREKINNLVLKLNFMLKKTETKKFEDFYSSIINTCLNDKNISYCLFFDKKNFDNTFLFFKYYYVEKNYRTNNIQVVFYDSYIVFPGKINEKNTNYNYVELKNLILDIKKADYVENLINKKPTVEIYNLKNLPNFNFEYFNTIINLRRNDCLFYEYNIGNFNMFNINNINLLRYVIENNNTKSFTERNDKIFYLIKKDNNEYEKILLEKDNFRNLLNIEINSGYFKEFYNSNCFNNHIHISNYYSHKILGPSKIFVLSDDEGNVNFSDYRNHYFFYIHGVVHNLEEYIEKLESILEGKEIMKFIYKYIIH